ncbi:ABC transporter substrate-binding protein [Cohnella abietis]|uniref:Ferrichrome ABC transporter substrate-binding protein n=1 Tax=Cohnella abietis TaxID=2507935 RepID=A0A3T1DBP7_9BACL|nr:ABC transporter substrate-binding protein [Cohnella abietis]BBI35523.1 ferrichrome ABC transporter substrate-binding protein [Cohnella abietis]
MYQSERAAHVSRRAKQGQRKLQGVALLLILFVFTVFVSACGNNTNTNTGANTVETQKPEQTSSAQPTAQSEEPQMITVKDAYGEKQVPLHPKRVAVIGLEDIALTLEAPLVYAYDFDGYYLHDQLQALHIQVSGSSDVNPNLEAILASKPDIIILQQYFTDQGGYDQLNKIAPTVAYPPDDWKSSIIEIGKILGIEEKAQSVIQTYDDKIKQAKETIEAEVPGKTVAFIRPSDKDLQVFFPSFNSLVYDQLGLKPDTSIATFQKQSPEDWGITTSLESLPLITADYVFAIYGGSISSAEDYLLENAASTEVEKLKVWKAIPAVKQNHVFKVSSRHWMSSGPIANSRVIEDVVSSVTGK